MLEEFPGQFFIVFLIRFDEVISGKFLDRILEKFLSSSEFLKKSSAITKKNEKKTWKFKDEFLVKLLEKFMSMFKRSMTRKKIRCILIH